MPLPTSNDGHGPPRERELARRQQHWSTVLSEGSQPPTPMPVESHEALPSGSAALSVTPALPSLPRQAPPRQPLPGPFLPPLRPDNVRSASLPTETTAQPRVSKLASFDVLLAVAKEQHMHFAEETPASASPPEVAGQPLEPPSSPRLRAHLGSSSASVDVSAEAANTRALASMRPQLTAPLRPVPSLTPAWPPPVRATSALLMRGPPQVTEVRSSQLNTSAGLELPEQTESTAPLASFYHGVRTDGSGPDGRAVTLPLPRLVGLPVSPPVSAGPLLRNRSVQEHSWTPSIYHPPSSLAAVTPTPLPERFSDETFPIGAAHTAFGAADLGPQLSKLPELPIPPVEIAPSAALSLLAETSNEQPPLQHGRKRSRDSPTSPLREVLEKPGTGELCRATAPRALREIPTSSVRLNPPVVGLPTTLHKLQPRRTAAPDPVPFPGSLLPPLTHPPPSVVGEELVHEPRRSATPANRSPPLGESALPSMGLQASEKDFVNAARASANPLLSLETVRRFGPLSTSSNPPLMQFERIVRSGSDNTALPSSRPGKESHPSTVQAQGRLGSSSVGHTDPAAGQEVGSLSARRLSSSPTQSIRPVASRSPVAQSTVEPKAPKEEAQVSWLCDRCSRPYKWKQTLQAHRRLCGMKTFACDECAERFDTKPPLETHKRNAHEKRAKRHFCHCGLSYENKSNLRRHERETHEQHAPAVCNQCGKSYPRKTSLHRHIMEKHMGEKRREDRSKQEKKEKKEKERETKEDP